MDLTTLLAGRCRGRARTREAIRCGEQSLTYGDLYDRAARLAGGLSAAGVAPGDRVAVLLRNRTEWFDAWFALARLGAVCVPINILSPPAEIAHVLSDTGAVALVVDDEAAAIVAALAELPPVVLSLESVARMASDAGALTAPPPGGDDPLSIYYSSGTTGAPKGATHTHSGVLWNSVHQIVDFGVTAEDSYLCVPSLSWAAGLHDFTLATLWQGGRVVVMPTGRTSIGEIAATARRERVTQILLVPTLLKQLLDDKEAQEDFRAAPLRTVLTGGEPIAVAVLEQLSEVLPGVLQGYGFSEFPTVAAALRPDEASTHVGSAGRPTSATEMAVLTDDGQTLLAGEGEVLVRSPATMVGYWGRPEETAEAFAGGWFHTGDTGRLDPDGFLTITGRKKDMIISGGLNVYPAEVEAVLARIDGVAEAAVVGIPDGRWGEVPVAVIVERGIGDADLILRQCRERLAGYKVPKQVLFSPTPLTRNPNGKLVKRQIRAWALEQLGSRT